jgi:Tfp pilus assembly protein PilX
MSGTVKSALSAPSRFEKERCVMHVQNDDRPRVAGSQAGFALVLAILSLMLLTFLGLTLATTTSTELQIATNYRWSQQAHYNAEAGLEAAKLLLAQVARVEADFRNLLPAPRAGTWNYGVTGVSGGPPDPRAGTPARAGLRDYERMGCADQAGVGYGRVLTSVAGTPQPGDYQDVSQYMGTSLNGAFTLWVRRALTVSPTGQLSDNADNTSLVVTAEGIAPFVSNNLTLGGSAQAGRAFVRSNQAREVLEVAYALLVDQGQRCQGLSGQEGLAPSGENFDPCSPLTAAGVGAAFGGQSGAERTGVR